MISYSYHVCIKIKFIPPLCLSLASGGGGDCHKWCSGITVVSPPPLEARVCGGIVVAYLKPWWGPLSL